MDFFKTCIVDFYCFEKHSTEYMWTKFPDFKDLIGTPYFNAMAKRVQLFFVRYNAWSNTLVNAKFRDVATGMIRVTWLPCNILCCIRLYSNCMFEVVGAKC